MDSKHSIRKVNILAVDDKPANLLALEAVLSDDYKLIFADSGDEALSILGSRKDIDVILMDLHMPGMDGYEAARRIKRIEGCGDIPIVFITAIYREEEFVRKGYEAGAVDYFGKPFDPEILKKKIAIYSSFRFKSALLRERERQIRETEELLAAGRKLSSVLENLPVGVLIADVEGCICQSNEAVARIVNTVEATHHGLYGEIIGWWDSNGKMIKNHDGPLARAIRGGTSSHNELIDIVCCDGAKKTIIASAAPLYGLDQHIVGAVVILQDITESKRIEEDLEARITKLISVGVELEQSVIHP